MKLGTLDYTKDIHPKMIRNVFLNAEILTNDNDFEIPEYDIQSMICKYLRNKLQNTEFTSYGEANGRFDCVIKSKNSNVGKVFFELKTYIKNTESPKIDEIKSDIKKLFNKLENDNQKAYFLVVIAKNKVKNSIKQELSFINGHYENNRKWVDIDGVKLRPSQKEKNGKLIVFSWEIKSNLN